ncbi:MAG: hypothetical protein Q4C75_06565, partial [Bergeyella zoohelcum]|nr:hypothetical protein [Bergeyella zoohelcum]
MSQNITTKNRFSTDEAIEIITNFNDEINEILSSSDVELGSIFTLKSKTESIIKLLFDSVLSGEYVFNSDNIKDNLLNIKKNIFDSEELENNFREKELTKRVFINDIIKLLYSLEEIINIYIDFINEFSFIRT